MEVLVGVHHHMPNLTNLLLLHKKIFYFMKKTTFKFKEESLVLNYVSKLIEL